MTKVSELISESLKEYLVLTGWVVTKPEEVSLRAKLGHISLQYPFMSARMQSVVGPEMAVAAGRQGILTMIPRSLNDEDKEKIIQANKKAKLKADDIEFQDDPVFASPTSTLEDVINIVKKVGHSVIPVMDRMSKLEGIYIHNPKILDLFPPWKPIREIISENIEYRLENEGGDIPYLKNTVDLNAINNALRDNKRRFIPIVNQDMILQKLAFLQKYDTNFIGIAISTRGNWKEELEKWGHRADNVCIDSSNACFDDALKILKYAKESCELKDKLFGIGNIIKAEDFKIFADAGADYLIGGMGVGSICQTGSSETGRGNGRGQMSVARELARAREEYKGKRYVPFVLDGGIESVQNMTVALAFADFIMMGNYFNKFYEAAGQKFDDEENPTNDEAHFEYVESWGEGHSRARLVSMYGIDFRRKLSKITPEPERFIERYGHLTLAGSTVEGVVGLVRYRGRLKPCVERDAAYLRTTISNAGASDLKSFREKAVVERASKMTLLDMLPHDIKITEID